MAGRCRRGPGRKRKRTAPEELELGVEEFLARNESLHTDVWRLYDLMKDLDVQASEKVKELTQEFSGVEDKVKKLKKRKPSQALQKQVRTLDDNARKICAEVRNVDETKVAIAQQGYDLLDRVVRELDHRIAIYEANVPQRDRMLPDSSGGRQEVLQSEALLKSNASHIRQQNKMLNGVPNGILDPSKHKRRRYPPQIFSPFSGAPMMFGCPPAMTPIHIPPSSLFRFQGQSGSQSFPKAFFGDDSEPVYCFCQQVAFGDMISCDNPKCPYEWFHFECVGISKTDLPKTEWFCPICRSKQEVARDGE